MKQIERFAALMDCPSEKNLLNSIIQLGSDFGFSHTLIALSPNRQVSIDKAFIRGNFSSQWLNTYERQQMINIDPRISHVLTHSTPLMWKPEIFSSTKQKEMYEEASSHGMRSGITLPFHGANSELGMLSFAADTKPCKRFQRDIQHHLPALSMMRDFAFESSLRFAKAIYSQITPALTQRELECLKWCAAGKSSWEIAQILKCSESTINFHFGNLRQKFHATSRRQVVVKAIHCGLLHDLPEWPQNLRESDKLLE